MEVGLGGSKQNNMNKVSLGTIGWLFKRKMMADIKIKKTGEGVGGFYTGIHDLHIKLWDVL